MERDGEQFTARVTVTPRRASQGTAIGFLVISKDISEELRLTDMSARILIIEDNPGDMDLMVYLLDAFGHTPSTTACAESPHDYHLDCR